MILKMEIINSKGELLSRIGSLPQGKMIAALEYVYLFEVARIHFVNRHFGMEYISHGEL